MKQRLDAFYEPYDHLCISIPGHSPLNRTFPLPPPVKKRHSTLQLKISRHPDARPCPPQKEYPRQRPPTHVHISHPFLLHQSKARTPLNKHNTHSPQLTPFSSSIQKYTPLTSFPIITHKNTAQPAIRTHVLAALLREQDALIRPLLAEALSAIVGHDYPDKWPQVVGGWVHDAVV